MFRAMVFQWRECANSYWNNNKAAEQTYSFLSSGLYTAGSAKWETEEDEEEETQRVEGIVWNVCGRYFVLKTYSGNKK